MRMYSMQETHVVIGTGEVTPVTPARGTWCTVTTSRVWPCMAGLGGRVVVPQGILHHTCL
jgi:hypothetical protein